MGKPVWVVRARNWKLRGGENRLLGLLEGVSVSGNVFKMIEQRFDDVWGFRLGLISQSKLESKWLWFLPYIASVGKARRQGGSNITFVQVWFLCLW
ncbi:hypothetical protein GQ457_01G014700 [Hibiscus cannabinus]